MHGGAFWYPRDIFETYMMCWSAAAAAARVVGGTLVLLLYYSLSLSLSLSLHYENRLLLGAALIP